MKRKNGDGTVVKMTGNRRKPWACRKVIGWKEDGRPILKYISYHKTKREAENALKRYNDDPYTLSNMTLDDLYKEWYAIQENEKAPETLRNYDIRYGHLKPIHDIKVTDITPFVLEGLYKTLDITKNTLNNVQTLVNLLIKYAVKRHYLPVAALNYSKAINLPAKDVKRLKPRTVISKEEIDMLWGMTDNEYAKVILFYIYTGLRYAELRDLDPKDYHGNYIEIKDSKTPAGVRVVPICDKLQRILPIVPVPNHTTFYRYFKQILPNHTIHETRHTFASMLADKGVDVRVIKSIVGHKQDDVTARYTHISLDVKLQAVNLL